MCGTLSSRNLSQMMMMVHKLFLCRCGALIVRKRARISFAQVHPCAGSTASILLFTPGWTLVFPTLFPPPLHLHIQNDSGEINALPIMVRPDINPIALHTYGSEALGQMPVLHRPQVSPRRNRCDIFTAGPWLVISLATYMGGKTSRTIILSENNMRRLHRHA